MNKLLDKVLGRILFYIGVLTQDYKERAAKDYNTFLAIKNTLETYMGKLKGKVILDVGCGRRYPYTLLLHSLGNRVVGIDSNYIEYSDSLIKRYWKELTRNGIEHFIRAILFDLLKQKSTYYKTLQQLSSFPLNHHGIIFRQMNAENMAFSDETFDLVVSILCFEHIANLRKAIFKIHRVLKRGGFAYVKIHLFTSRGGGHQLGKEFFRVPPWDHLRQNRFPAPVYLNKLRKDEWFRLFSEKFEILEVISEADRNAENLLRAEVLSELSAYSKDELTTSTITIVAQKRHALK